jgi:hypothetical protein
MDNRVLGMPLHRTIVVVDVEGSTMLTNPERALMRERLRRLLDAAFLAGGIDEEFRDPMIDRGDGALCLVRPVDEVPKTVLLTRFLPALAEALWRAAEEPRGEALRLRVALHAGDVHYDGHGAYGEDIDFACRLLDAPVVKRSLKNSPDPLVLVVSSEIYRTVVRHGYEGIDSGAFDHEVSVRVGSQRMRGRIRSAEPVLPGTGLSA